MTNGVSGAVRAAIADACTQALAVNQRWRQSRAWRQLGEAFAHCPACSAEPAAAVAGELLADTRWVDALLAPLVDALAADPFYEPPLRNSRDALRTGMVIYECEAATLTASVLSAAALAVTPPPATIVFSGRLAVTRYLRSGNARLRRWRADAVTPGFSAAGAAPALPLPDFCPADGDVLRTDGRTHGQLIADAGGDVVTLGFTMRAGVAPLMREYAVDDGRLVRVASADDGASRVEMLLTYLRMAGRADAGPRFEEASHDPAFQLRWAAMREWLALDARAALPRLAEMADGDPNAEVRAAAGATLHLVRARVAEAGCHG